MYKLMIVDDEVQILERIISKIDWSYYGFEVVAKALNGSEALEKFEKYKPDVVITDIEMPYMDGLELAKRILAINAYTKIIILTGYDDFQYAKEAINLNVSDYILKPIIPSDFKKFLSELKVNLDMEIENKKNVRMLSDYYKNNYDISKENFMKSISRNTLNNDEINIGLNNYSFIKEHNYYLVSVVTIADVQSEIEDNLVHFSIINTLEEINESYLIGQYFVDENKIICITYADQKNELYDITTKILNELVQFLEKYLHIKVIIGIGDIVDNIYDVHKSRRRAFKALDYRLVIEDTSLIYINDIEPEKLTEYTLSELIKSQITRTLKTGTKNEVVTLVDDIYTNLLSSTQSDEEIQIFNMKFITIILTVCKDLNIDFNKFISSENDLIIRVINEKSLHTINKIMKDICIAIVEIASSSRIEIRSSLIKNVCQYIDDNYKTPELTIESIAFTYHVSPNYLSSIFKKEVKCTFSKYLTEKRLIYAKDLLENTDMKNFEIAESIGFSDPNYFSYCFKKNCGITPGQYRKMVLNE